MRRNRRIAGFETGILWSTIFLVAALVLAGLTEPRAVIAAEWPEELAEALDRYNRGEQLNETEAAAVANHLVKNRVFGAMGAPGGTIAVSDPPDSSTLKLGSRDVTLGPENFSGTFPPPGWSILDTGGTGDSWEKKHEIYNGFEDYAGFGRTPYTTDVVTTIDLITPAFSTVGYDDVLLILNAGNDTENNFYDGELTVAVSTDDGMTWTDVGPELPDNDWCMPWVYGPEFVDLTAAAGQNSTVRVRFRASGQWGICGGIDNVWVVARPTAFGPENFGGTFPPAGWTVSEVGSGTPWFQRTWIWYHDGADPYAAFYQTGSADPGFVSDLITPAFSTAGLDRAAVVFDVGGNADPAGFAISVSPDDGVTWEPVLSGLQTTSSQYPIESELNLDITEAAQGSPTTRVRFRGVGNNTAHIDNVRVEPPLLGCAGLLEPATSSVGLPHGVVALEWSAPPAPHDAITGYRIDLGTDDPPTNILHDADLGDITELVLTELAAETVYHWRITPYSNLSEQPYCPVWTFETSSAIGAADHPWVEVFDDLHGNVPPMWAPLANTTSGEAWSSDTMAAAGAGFDHTTGGGAFVLLDDSAPDETPTDLVSPVFDLSEAVDEAEAFLWHWNRATPGSPVSDLDIQVSVDGGATYTPWTLLGLEDFDGGAFPPDGWMVTDVGATGNVWMQQTSPHYPDTYAYFSVNGNTGTVTDLVSPAFSTTGFELVTLRFLYESRYGHSFSVSVSADNGATWQELPPPPLAWDGLQVPIATYEEDITSLVGGSDFVQVRFRGFFESQYWAEAAVDDVVVLAHLPLADLSDEAAEWTPAWADLTPFIGESNVRLRLRGIETTGEDSDLCVDDFQLRFAQPELSVSDVTVTEGSGKSSVAFTVEMDAWSGKTVTVDWALTDGTATAPEDYAATSGTLTYLPGEKQMSITVDVVEDNLDEFDETVVLTLTNPVFATLADVQATAVITDDDPMPEMSVADVTLDESAGTAAVTVALSEISGRDVEVDWTTTSGTAVSPADFGSDTGTLVIPAGVASLDVVTIIVDDPNDEYDESFTVDLTGQQYATLVDASAQVTIVDDDLPPEMSVADILVNEGDGIASFTVNLTEFSGKPIQLDWASVAGTASDPEDFDGGSATVDIPVGSPSVSISVPIVDDLLDEYDESFTVNLSNNTNSTLVDGESTATIADDDPEPQLAAVGLEIVESGGQADVTITLSAASGKEVQFDWATSDGTAAAGTDYASASASVSIDPGATTATAPVQILDDALDEDVENFSVTLTNNVNAIIDAGVATVSITDDDPLPEMSVADVTVDEGAGVAAVTVSLSEISGRDVEISWETAEGTATSPEDFVSDSGTLILPAGLLSSDAIIAIGNDALDEHDESFTIEFSNPVNAALVVSSAVVTITDDDPLPEISITDAVVDEGAGAVGVAVSLSTVSGRDVEVTWTTTDGEATSPGDFAGGTGTVVVPAGSLTIDAVIAIVDDPIDEIDESFTVELSSPQYAELDDASAGVTITDNDLPPEMSISDLVVNEAAGTAVITVSLSLFSSKPIQVDYATTPGTAMDPEDFTGVASTMEIPAGSSSGVLLVTINDDILDEAEEVFTVTLSNSVNSSIVDGSAIVVIEDDDPMSVLSAEAVSVREDRSPATVLATLDVVSGRDIQVSWATSDGTATSPEDYTAGSGLITIPAGMTEGTAEIVVIDDVIFETDEDFSVVFSAPVAVSLGVEEVACVIVDDDDPSSIFDDGFESGDLSEWSASSTN